MFNLANAIARVESKIIDTEMAKEKTDSEGRKYIGMYFKCCNVYTRIYKSRLGDRYVGFCPKCGAKVQLMIGAGGVNDRFFIAK